MKSFPTFTYILVFFIQIVSFSALTLHINQQVVCAATLTDTTATMGVQQEMQSGGSSSSMNTPAPSQEGDATPAAVAQLAKDKAEAQKRGSVALANGWLGPGGYLSISKWCLFLFVFFMWVLTVDWVSRDGELQKIENRLTWNMANYLPYMVLGTILFYLPISTPIAFYISYPILILTWLIPAFCYISVRNKPLPPYERVMTPSHIKYLLAVALNKIGIKIKLQKNQSYQTGPPVEIVATGKNLDNVVLGSRTILSRNHPGFNDLRAAVFDALQRKADSVMLDFGSDQTTIRQQIDGVWHEVGSMPKDRGEATNVAARLLVGGNAEDRRGKLAGSFLATLNKKTKFSADLVIGTAQNSEEKAVITFVIQKVPFDTLEELGMRPDTQEKVKALVNAPTGLVVFSSAPANGLRSTMNVVARTADRFTRDFATVEDKQNPYQIVENVALNQYDSSKGETPITVLPDIFFREPQVMLLRDLVNLESFTLCCEEIQNNRLIITTARAKDAADTFLRLLAMKIQPQLFASSIKAVVSQRLIRKLCPDCKESFQPQPALLQRLGLPPDKISQLCRVRSAPQPGEKRKPCLTCNDIGYTGRTAMYEVIEVNDEIRKILVSAPSIEAIRRAANQSGQRGFLFEGALLIAKGITSVEELARVMKM